MSVMNEVNEASPAGETGDLERLVSRIHSKAHRYSAHHLCSRYRGYEIEIGRDDGDDDWYIRVSPIGGSYLYDGWWRDSFDQSEMAAIREALRGAMILGG